MNSLDQLKLKLTILEAETQEDSTQFRDLYNFTYSFAKNPQQKSLDLDVAIPYWNMLLHGRFALLEMWTEFLQVL